MIDITIYITEGGFFKNTGTDKYIDIIKNFGNIIASQDVKKELGNAAWLSDMPKTNIYKKLYDLFNDIKKYEVKFDNKIYFPTSGSTCTEHYVGTRNGDKFSLLRDRTYDKHPKNNRSIFHEYNDASGLLSQILYHIQDTCDFNVLRDTAKFTIK